MVRMGNRAFDVLECYLRDALRLIEGNVNFALLQ